MSGQFDAMSNDLDHCYNVPVFVDDLVEGEEVFTVSVNLKTSLSPSLSQKLVIDQTRVKITIVDTSKCHTQLSSTCIYHIMLVLYSVKEVYVQCVCVCV